MAATPTGQVPASQNTKVVASSNQNTKLGATSSSKNTKVVASTNQNTKLGAISSSKNTKVVASTNQNTKLGAASSKTGMASPTATQNSPLQVLSDKIAKDSTLRSKIKVDLVKKTAIANNVKLNDLKSVLTDLGVPLQLTEVTIAKDINNVPIKSLFLQETADKNKKLILALENVPMDKFIKPIISALGNLKVPDLGRDKIQFAAANMTFMSPEFILDARGLKAVGTSLGSFFTAINADKHFSLYAKYAKPPDKNVVTSGLDDGRGGSTVAWEKPPAPFQTANLNNLAIETTQDVTKVSVHGEGTMALLGSKGVPLTFTMEPGPNNKANVTLDFKQFIPLGTGNLGKLVKINSLKGKSILDTKVPASPVLLDCTGDIDGVLVDNPLKAEVVWTKAGSFGLYAPQVKFSLDEFFERQGLRDGPDIDMELVGSFEASKSFSSADKLKRTDRTKDVPYKPGIHVISTGHLFGSIKTSVSYTMHTSTGAEEAEGKTTGDITIDKEKMQHELDKNLNNAAREHLDDTPTIKDISGKITIAKSKAAINMTLALIVKGKPLSLKIVWPDSMDILIGEIVKEVAVNEEKMSGRGTAAAAKNVLAGLYGTGNKGTNSSNQTNAGPTGPKGSVANNNKAATNATKGKTGSTGTGATNNKAATNTNKGQTGSTGTGATNNKAATNTNKGQTGSTGTGATNNKAATNATKGQTGSTSTGATNNKAATNTNKGQTGSTGTGATNTNAGTTGQKGQANTANKTDSAKVDQVTNDAKKNVKKMDDSEKQVDVESRRLLAKIRRLNREVAQARVSRSSSSDTDVEEEDMESDAQADSPYS